MRLSADDREAVAEFLQRFNGVAGAIRALATGARYAGQWLGYDDVAEVVEEWKRIDEKTARELECVASKHEEAVEEAADR